MLCRTSTISHLNCWNIDGRFSSIWPNLFCNRSSLSLRELMLSLISSMMLVMLPLIDVLKTCTFVRLSISSMSSVRSISKLDGTISQMAFFAFATSKRRMFNIFASVSASIGLADEPLCAWCILDRDFVMCFCFISTFLGFLGVIGVRWSMTGEIEPE